MARKDNDDAGENYASVGDASASYASEGYEGYASVDDGSSHDGKNLACAWEDDTSFDDSTSTTEE